MNSQKNRIIFKWLSKWNPILTSCLVFGFYSFIFFFLLELYYNTYFEPPSFFNEEYISNPNWDFDFHQLTIKLILALSTVINGYITYLMFTYRPSEGRGLEHTLIVFIFFFAFSLHFILVDYYEYFY